MPKDQENLHETLKQALKAAEHNAHDPRSREAAETLRLQVAMEKCAKRRQAVRT